MVKQINLLAVSGSLRASSYNTRALQAISRLAPAPIQVRIAPIDKLPLFNPDREDEPITALADLKAALSQSHGLIIASPEYAHGISGPMKNALDWLVSGAEFPYLPIMLINTSPRAHHAQDALREVLRTMSGIVVDSACVTLPLLGSNLDETGILADPQMVAAMSHGLNKFHDFIVLHQAENNGEH